jgi:hypothetical protein
MTEPQRLARIADAAYRLRAGDATTQDQRLVDEFALEPMTGGFNNPLYRFDLHGRTLCLKLPLVDDRRRGEREWRALTLLTRRGTPAVPEPVWRSEHPDRPAIVMTFAPGAALGADPLQPRQADALIEALDALYAITPNGVDQPVPDVVTPAAAMVARMHRTWTALQADSAGITDPDRQQLLQGWRRWSAGPQPRQLTGPAPRAFGRGDPSLANFLWDGTRLTLLDFEYSGWTDPAFELADLVEHTQSRATPDRTWDQLVDRFDLDRPARQRHHAARQLMCFFWLARWWRDNDPRFPAQADRARHLLADLLGGRAAR